MSGAEAEVSSRPAGDRLPGPAEVQLPSAGNRPQTFWRLYVRQEKETSASKAKDADAGGDPEKHQLHRMEVDALHQTEGSSRPLRLNSSRHYLWSEQIEVGIFFLFFQASKENTSAMLTCDDRRTQSR